MMYKTQIFETAIKESGYIADKFKYTDKSREVRKVDGLIPIVKIRIINGVKKHITEYKRVRWDASGKCFSQRSNVRFRKWDLDVRGVYARTQQYHQSFCNRVIL